MPTVHLSCPHCSHKLRSNRLIAPAEQLRCPHCGSWFRAGRGDTSSRAAPRRGILLAWLLFANFVLLTGGGIALAVVLGNRAKHQSSESVGWTSKTRPTSGVVVGLEDSAHPTDGVPSDYSTDPTSTPASTTMSIPQPPPVPVAPPRKSPPAPDRTRKPPADPPKPPILPEPPKRQAEQPVPAKKKTEKPAEPEKRRSPKHQETAQIHWLPPSLQDQVNRSIDRGVEFLRRRQHADGSWGHQTGTTGKRFTSGITALSALTLLECGVPAKDGQVRAAAHYLRQRMPELTSTYSISLTLLFFDRLGDESDAARIRTLALRLIAGQRSSGGWDYYCPTLSPDEELGLLALLYKDRPTSPLDLFAVERKQDAPKLNSGLYRPRPSKIPPLDLFIAQDPALANRNPPSASHPPEKELSSHDPKESAVNDKRKADSALPGDNRRLSKRALEAADKLPEALRRIPALRSAELLRDPPNLHEPRTDNSNTQFAILGLLTAENYDVPMERAMTLLDWRFRNSMTVQGGWNYRPTWQTSPSMTAAALMGLALKHGLLLPNRSGRGRNVTVHDDEIIHRGFLTLTEMLDHFYSNFGFNRLPLDKLDLYCLWTVERVAVLYSLREMDGLQWYPAGVQLLLPLQREDGSWSPKGTNCLDEPSVSSSFALLFLKRSNLARGLTERLNVPE